MRFGEGGFGGWHPREWCRVVLPPGPAQSRAVLGGPSGFRAVNRAERRLWGGVVSSLEAKPGLGRGG